MAVRLYSGLVGNFIPSKVRGRVPDPDQLAVSTLHCLPGLEVLEARRSNFHFALRARAEYTILLVKEGAERFVHRGKVVIAPKGSVILINPNEAHNGEAARQERSYSAIYPSPALLRELLPQQGHSVCPVFRETLIQDPLVARKLGVFIDSAFSSHTPLGLRGIFRELMIDVLAKYTSAGCGLERLPKSRAAVLVVRDRLASAPEQNVSLWELAQETGMSPLSLLRSFRHYVGCTPHVFQISQRLGLAKSLLRSGESIAQAASASGFVDQSHFTNTLRRWTGLTPARYMRSIRLA